MANKSSDPSNDIESSDPIQVAKHYLEIMKNERERLNVLATNAEKEHDQLLENDDIDEEILGQIRSTAGKARLLATKKFKQFEGFCDDCINQITRDMPPPTSGDLLGLWDVICLQVENVDELFKVLDEMRTNGWKKLAQPKPKQLHGVKLTKRPQTSSKVNTSGALKKSTDSVTSRMKNVTVN